MRFVIVFFPLFVYGFLFSQPRQAFIIVAHRGGVVNDTISENSIDALEEAIRRGYTHVEVDARITADGHVVCFHNDDLYEETGVNGKISAMDLPALRQVKLIRSREAIPTFDEYCQKLAGRIGIMVDIKGCKKEQIDDYVFEIESALTKYQLLKDALILINKTPVNNQELIAERFLGKAKISWRESWRRTRKAAASDPQFASKYYIFNHGADFNLTRVQNFQSLGLKVIVSINKAHYREGYLQKGKQHLTEMLNYGVDGVQIDADYDEGVF